MCSLLWRLPRAVYRTGRCRRHQVDFAAYRHGAEPCLMVSISGQNQHKGVSSAPLRLPKSVEEVRTGGADTD